MKVMKSVFAVLLSALLALGILPMSLAAPAAEEGDLLLATMSDVHYYPASLAKYKGKAFYDYTRGHNCVYDNLDGVIDSAFAAIKKDAEEKGLNTLVLCGDLTTNGEYEGHVALAEKLRALEEETGVSVYVINGNHDVNNPDASAFVTEDGKRTEARRTTATDFYEIYKDFGFSEAVSTYSAPDTGKAGALSYAVEKGAYRLIMIDAGKYTADNTEKKQDLKETGGNVTEGVLEWVKQEAAAAKAKGQTPIAFTHWNLSEMNYLHGEVLQGFVIDDGYRLQELFADMGIHYVYSGHQHVCDLDVTYSDAGEPLYSVITPILTQYPYAFRETAFSAKDGKVTARFDRRDVDEVQPVVSLSGEAQASPYRITGFHKQFGDNDPATYLTWMVKGMLGPWVEQIKETGSIVTFIKDKFGLDLRQTVAGLIKNGLVFGDTEIFTADNLLSLIADVDEQLVETYIYHPNRLWTAISKAIGDILTLEVSSLPCTAFLDDYGFGDPEKPGTLGDAFFSAMVYMYSGNEDISADAFIQDALKTVATVDFVDRLFDRALDVVVQGLLVDELLSNIQVNVDALFNGKAPTVAQALAMFYRVVSAFSASGVFKSGSFAEFISRFSDIIDALMNRSSATSYAYLLQRVLSTGWIKAGTNAKELAQGILDGYIGQDEKEAAAWQIGVVVSSVFFDEDRDYGENYDYTGPVKVVPTKEDMQIPTDVTLRLTGSDGLRFRWLTKYSVEGTSLRLFDSAGKALSPEVETKTETADYTSFGFSFGSFGILPYTREVVVHEATVTGLTPGETYSYQIGDEDKNFWSEKAEFTLPDEGKAPALLFAANVAATTPEGYARWAKNIKLAAEGVPGAKAVILGGGVVLDPKDDAQFSRAVNAAEETLRSVPLYYVWSASDTDETGRAALHFGFDADDPFAEPAAGAAYVADLGALRFAALSAADLDADGTLSGVQLRNIKNKLGATGKAWRVLSVNADVWNNSDVRNQIGEIADTCGVDLVLIGGDAYSRSFYRVGGGFMPTAKTKTVTVAGESYEAYEPEGGSVWLTSGSAAGRGAETPTKADFAVIPEGTANDLVTVVRFDADALGVKALRAGETLDAFALAKTETRVLLGDVDRDGKITAADARLALRAAVSLEDFDAAQKKIGDVDRDGKITAADARSILRAAVELDELRPKYVSVYADMR